LAVEFATTVARVRAINDSYGLQDPQEFLPVLQLQLTHRT
jgi:hypothetical protein